MTDIRGSEKLLSAWKLRTLSEEGVKEIAARLDESPAEVLGARVHGDGSPDGATLVLRYTGDEVAWCGNDIEFWLQWHRKWGGGVRPPHIIINGIPFPDELLMELHYGRAPEAGPLGEVAQFEQLR